jgi:hypothetical protein
VKTHNLLTAYGDFPYGFGVWRSVVITPLCWRPIWAVFCWYPWFAIKCLISLRRSYQQRPVTASLDQVLYSNVPQSSTSNNSSTHRQSGRISYVAGNARTQSQVGNSTRSRVIPIKLFKNLGPKYKHSLKHETCFNWRNIWSEYFTTT